jgi:hypothetical protein
MKILVLECELPNLTDELAQNNFAIESLWVPARHSLYFRE